MHLGARTVQIIPGLQCYERVSSCRCDGFPEEEYNEWIEVIPDELKPFREQVYFSLDTQMYFHFKFPSDQAAALFRLRWK